MPGTKGFMGKSTELAAHPINTDVRRSPRIAAQERSGTTVWDEDRVLRRQLNHVVGPWIDACVRLLQCLKITS